MSLSDFLSEVSLLTDQDDDKNEKANAVTLMTVHASKGLEYGKIYIVGMEENLFPSQRAESLRDMEEERRLFYVAITRAKECCTISYAKSRFRYGQSQFSSPSRFLYDIDPKYINMPQKQAVSKMFVNPYALSSSEKADKPVYYRERSTERSSSRMGQKAEIIRPVYERRLKPLSHETSSTSYSSAGCEYLPGDVVVHSIFGKGTVVAIEGAGDNAKAKIDFETQGQKQLLLRYARLKKI